MIPKGFRPITQVFSDTEFFCKYFDGEGKLRARTPVIYWWQSKQKFYFHLDRSEQQMVRNPKSSKLIIFEVADIYSNRQYWKWQSSIEYETSLLEVTSYMSFVELGLSVLLQKPQ